MPKKPFTLLYIRANGIFDRATALFRIIGSVGTIIGAIRLLEWFLAHLPAV
jgi:hypothetical protein